MSPDALTERADSEPLLSAVPKAARETHWLRRTAACLLGLIAAVLCAVIGASRWRPANGTATFCPTSYATISGFFQQDESHTLLSDAFNDRSGLLDPSDDGWPRLAASLRQMNQNRSTAYKLFYLARHGQGYHNVAEAVHGTHDWDCHWSFLTTDGNLTYGPECVNVQLPLE
jgi:hypothetical protein